MLQAALEPGKNGLPGGSNDRFRVHENNSCFLLPRLTDLDGPHGCGRLELTHSGVNGETKRF